MTISAAAIAEALNGRSSGSGYVCECPAHVDLRPSLSVTARDGRVLVHCHAGCAQSAVIGALRRQGLWGDAIVLGSKRGNSDADTRDTLDAPTPPISGEAERDPMRPWRRAMPFSRGCIADFYLERRGIDLTDDEACSLRCSTSLFHWPTKTHWPAMLARVALADGTDLTTHQTFLACDGSGKAPLGDKARLFAAGGGWAGGGVWFGDAALGREFVVGEGIESTLSAMRLLGAASGCAALSEGGVRRLALPSGVKKIRIFADHDAKGQGLASAQAAKRRWISEGREVAISIAPTVGDDANDILLERLGRR